MAFQNVGTPRFYVDTISWLSFHDHDMKPAGVNVGINPSNISYGAELGTICMYGDHDISISSDIEFTFMAILGHNHAGELLSPHFKTAGANMWCSFSNIANSGATGSDTIRPQYNGFTIVEITSDDHYENENIEGIHLDSIENYDTSSFYTGAFLWGKYYDMPNSPNLSLTMSREYGSTKEFTTLNGSSMSNTMWSSPPKWGNLGAWELSSGALVELNTGTCWVGEGIYDPNITTSLLCGLSGGTWEADTAPPPNTNQAASRTSRRTWQLKFSFMDDSDLWGSNQMLSKIRYDISDGTDAVDYMSGDDNLFVDNLLTNDNFFSQVWHKTLGGTLPFIFQPDKGNNNPDQFAICRFKDNSLKATQSAFNVYDISLSIEEVW